MQYASVQTEFCLFLPPVTKLGQGNIFRIACQEFCPQGGGVCPIACWDTHPPTRGRPPGADTPQEQTPPWEQTPPGSRHPPWEQTPPRADTPPEQTPPATVHAGRYGQQAGGTLPTRMHTCVEIFFVDYKYLQA